MKKLPAFQFVFPTVESEDPHIMFEMSEREYQVIGMVTVQWSYLEHAMSMIHERMCKMHKVELSPKASSLSFKDRLRAWYEFLDWAEGKAKNVETFKKIHARIANASAERHKLIHGIWDYDPLNPFGATLSSTRKRLEFEQKTDLDRVYKLYTEIGRINFLLTIIPINGVSLNELPRTGIAKDQDGATIGHIHRSMLLSPEDRKRLFPELKL